MLLSHFSSLLELPQLYTGEVPSHACCLHYAGRPYAPSGDYHKSCKYPSCAGRNGDLLGQLLFLNIVFRQIFVFLFTGVAMLEKWLVRLMHRVIWKGDIWDEAYQIHAQTVCFICQVETLE